MADSQLFDVALDYMDEMELIKPDARMLQMQIQSLESTVAALKAKNARLESENACMSAKLEQVHANFILVQQASRRELSKLVRSLNEARRKRGLSELKTGEEKKPTKMPSLDPYTRLNYNEIITYLKITSHLSEDFAIKPTSSPNKATSSKSLHKSVVGRFRSSSSCSSSSSSGSYTTSGSSSSSSSPSALPFQPPARRGGLLDKPEHKSSAYSQSSNSTLPVSAHQQHQRLKTKPKINLAEQACTKHKRSTEEGRVRERHVDLRQDRGEGHSRQKPRNGTRPPVSPYKRRHVDEQISSRISSTRPRSSRHGGAEREIDDRHMEQAKLANHHDIKSPLKRFHNDRGLSTRQTKQERERERRIEPQASTYSTVSHDVVSSADSQSPERAIEKQRSSPRGHQDSVSVSPIQNTSQPDRRQFSSKYTQRAADKATGPVVQADRPEAQLLRAVEASVRSARDHHSASITLCGPTPTGKRLTTEEQREIEAHLHAEEQRCIEQLPISAAVKKAQSLSPHLTGGTIFTKRQRVKTDSMLTITTATKEEEPSSLLDDKTTPQSAPDPAPLTTPPSLQELVSKSINGDVDVYDFEPIRPGRPRTPPDEREGEAHYQALDGGSGVGLDDDEELDFRDDQIPLSPIAQLDKAISATAESPQIDIENEDEVREPSVPLNKNGDHDLHLDIKYNGEDEAEEREDGEMVSDYEDDDQDEVGGDTDRSFTRRSSKCRPHHHHHRRERTCSPPIGRLAEPPRRHRKLVEEGDEDGGEEVEEFQDEEEDEIDLKRARYSDQRGTVDQRRPFSTADPANRRRTVRRSVSGTEYPPGGGGKQIKRFRTSPIWTRKRSPRRPSPINTSSQRALSRTRQHSAFRESRFSRQQPYRMPPAASRYSGGAGTKSDLPSRRSREVNGRNGSMASESYRRRAVASSSNRFRQFEGKFNSFSKRSRFGRR